MEINLAAFAVAIITVLAGTVGVVIYFSKKQFDKVEAAFNQSANTMLRMDILEKQVSAVSKMAEDIAVLKYAILQEIGNEKNPRGKKT